MTNQGFYPAVEGIGVPRDYFFEVSKGNVPGETAVNVVASNPQVGQTTEDLWDIGGILVYPTAGEQWEIFSSSANDATGGSGAREVTVKSLNDSYIRQSETIALNGTTPVSFTATNNFRHEVSDVTDVGSGAKNEGLITIRAIGGNPRGGIVAGANASLDGHYTVPAGVTSFMFSLYEEINKNEDIVLDFLATIGIDGIFKRFLLSSLYQDTSLFPFTISPGKFVEKTDFKIEATSSNLISRPLVVAQIIEVVNL